MLERNTKYLNLFSDKAADVTLSSKLHKGGVRLHESSS